MEKERQSDAVRRKVSLVGFSAAILLFVLIGLATFVAFKLASSAIGV